MCTYAYVLPHPPRPACLPLPRAHLPTPRSTSVPNVTRRSAVTPAGGCGLFLLSAPALCFLMPSPPPPPAGVCRSDRSHGAYRLPGHHRPAVGNRVPSNHPGESVSRHGRSALSNFLTPSLAPNPQLPTHCPSFLHTQSSIARVPFPSCAPPIIYPQSPKSLSITSSSPPFLLAVQNGRLLTSSHVAAAQSCCGPARHPPRGPVAGLCRGKVRGVKGA